LIEEKKIFMAFAEKFVVEHVEKIMHDYSEANTDHKRHEQARKMERFFELLVHRLLVDITDE
jgi:hypothetical protein